VSVRYALAAVLVVLAGYLLTGVVEVRPGECAVVRRFGRVVATPGPGLWVGLPWGMDRVDRVPLNRVRRVAVGYQPTEDDNPPADPPGQLLTGDHNLVNVQVVLHYSVDPERVVDFVEQGDRADELVARAAEVVLAGWAAGRRIDDVLLNGKVELPELLAREVPERIAPYRLGVRLHQDVAVAHLFPPEEVRNAFEEVTRAEASVRTREHEARQEASRLLREAETERHRLETQAEAYVRERLELARAEAARFEARLAQYRRLRRENPDFLAGLWWDELGKLLTKLRETGRIDLLDNHLAGDGLDVTVFPPPPKKK
jgi:membrane protease subunit HflK